MVATTSFLAFGLLGGFAYLAYTKERELLCYGLAGVGIAFFLEGIRIMVGDATGFGIFLDVLHHIALGVGGAFLAYVAALEGWKQYGAWKERRHEAALAFQARLAAAKRPGTRDSGETSITTRPTSKRTGA